MHTLRWWILRMFDLIRQFLSCFESFPKTSTVFRFCLFHFFIFSFFHFLLI